MGQKEEGNSAIKFLILSIAEHERLFSFLSEPCKSVDISMKLHAPFPSTLNKLWVGNNSCFRQKNIGTS